MGKLGVVQRAIRNVVRFGTMDFFRAVEIETMTACNRHCTYCPNSKFDRGLIKNNQLLDEAVFRKVIDELAALKFDGRLSPHFYNEPLMDERLVKLLSYAREKLPNAEIVIFSNGDYLDMELFKKLGAAGVNSLDISQHGEKMPPAVKAILELQSRGLTEGLPKIHYKIPKQDVFLNNRGGLVEGDPNGPTLKYCNAPTHVMTIDYQGNVVLCCNDYLSTTQWGNVKSERLLDIWRKREFKDLRSKLRNGVFNLQICKICANPNMG